MEFFAYQACFEAALQSGTLNCCHCGRPAGFGLVPREVRAQTPGKPLLPTNLKFFDGQTLSIREGRDILFEAGRISALPTAGQGPDDADRIDCGGRNVILGLIGSHWHAMLASVTNIVAMTQDAGLVYLPTGREAGAPCSAALPRSAMSAARPSG